MSPWLPLQPVCLSLLLLGLSFEILWYEPPTRPAWRYVVLLLLFALWANLDAWFVLGPVLVALFWLGEFLGPSSERRTPGWLVPAAVAVCLLNPHFHRVFAFPAEISPKFSQ